MKILIAILLLQLSSMSWGAKVSESRQTIYLAGGCFWGVEDLFRKLPGVLSTDVGYSGGTSSSPTYLTVKTGSTGHAETVKIEFDPAKTSYAKILDFFFQIHDPTTVDRQGNDVGTQYRSTIFYQNEEQRVAAESSIDRATKSQRWKRPIVTKVEAFGVFTLAESYHQDYLVKNPQGYTCHWVRP